MEQPLPDQIVKYYKEKNISVISFRHVGMTNSGNFYVYHNINESLVYDKWNFDSLLTKWKIAKNDEICLPKVPSTDKLCIVVFDYKHGSDTEPEILYLGKYTAGNGSSLVCGINLNYLDESQKEDLINSFQQIVSWFDTQDLVKAIRFYNPKIFDIAYRRYNEESMHIKKIMEMDI